MPKLRLILLFLACFPHFAFALQNPVLLIHGATRGGGYIRRGPFPAAPYFANVIPIFTAHHAQVFIPNIPMLDANREMRARFLQKYIKENIGDRPFHIVAHSLAGADARYLIHTLHQKNVLSLTTIATPHRGTPLADFFKRALDQQNFWFYFPRLIGFHIEHLGFLRECTLDAMEKFNQDNPDDPSIAYYSIVASGEPWIWNMTPILWPLAFFGYWGAPPHYATETDGVVPVASQPWGKVLDQIYLDHLGQLNYHWLRFPQQETARKMYLTIINALEILETTSRK